jgi:hypothetical protein
MDSVYDAALAYAEKLKAELETLQNFLDLHEHFRDHFGLTPPAATSPVATAVAETPVVEAAGATSKIDVKEPAAEVDNTVDAEAAEAEADELQASDEAPTTLDAEPDAETSTDAKPRVIQASEGVLIATPSEASAVEPLGPEATLQSVADKLAATISASHPSVTGYTV